MCLCMLSKLMSSVLCIIEYLMSKKKFAVSANTCGSVVAICSMTLNHSTNSSLMPLAKGCPLGPYAIHRVEYLQRPFLMLVILAAAVSSLSHCILDMPEIWNPHVNLGKPDPVNSSFAFLLILARDWILTKVLLAFLAL